MAALSHPQSRRMYSWWWDSHISPKNSRWLQENLTDMDAKVKAMIKLIEEDADSFARRAEMYYKKRPELMKLVEEFYRAYRALAERYDNATGVLRQAHRSMAEAFPNQVPLVLGDDSPVSSASETDPRTPEMSTPVRALFDPDDLQNDALGQSSSHFHAVKRNGACTEESDSVTNRKGLKQFNDLFGSGDDAKLGEGRVRKGLNFHEEEEKEQSFKSKENHITQDRGLSESEVVGKFEKEIQTLKEALAKLEAEKESGLAQYQLTLERLSKLESDVSRAQEDSRGLNERANKAEGEVQSLREALTKLEAEKEASLLQYQQCLERIANLENVLSHAKKDAGELNERAHKAETEAQAVKQDLVTVEAEKDAALDQYKQSLDMISTLENKLLLAEEDARKLSERADKAEREVETLKQAIAKLTEEKEAAALQYQLCLETILSLEHKISCAQEEVQRLNGEIDSGVAKLKGAEEQCLLLERSNQSLHSELESLVLKTGAQSEELTEKQKELGRMWTCIQEERLRFLEAETAFQTLQHLHSQTQEDLRSLASELQNRAQLLRDIETCNQNLQDEVLKLKEENKSLSEINLSSAMSMKDMQNEIFSLTETKGKLEEEVELRMDERNALQQEIYCLKEELNELNKKHQAVVDQVEAVGFSPDCFKSSVKELQDENLNLKETCEREISEKVALLEKLEIMEQLLEKNAILEKSLSDLSAELEGARGKINALEESFQSLLEEESTLVVEKATLITQLQVTTENLEKLSEKNTFLENSLSDAHYELEGLKLRSKTLEDSCQLLENEKCGLIDEKDTLVSQVEITRQRLEDLEKGYRELEEKYSALEKKKESTLREVEELRVSLDVQKQEHASLTKMSETQLAGLENQICFLQEEGRCRRRDFEEELDKSLKYQLQIFILQRSVQDLEEKSCSLLIEFHKLLDASKLSEQLISNLGHKNLEQQVEVESLSDQTSRFRMGMYELLKAFDIDLGHRGEEKIGQDQTYLKHMLSKIEDTKNSLREVHDENQKLALEMSVLVTVLGHLRVEATTVEMERNILDQEFRIKNEQFCVLQIEANKLLEMNEELQLKVREKDQKEEVLTTEIENLGGKLLDMQGACQIFQSENLKVLEEKRSLTKKFLDLEEKNRTLEGENFSIVGEMLSLSNLSLIFKNIINEKSVELKELNEDLDKLHGVNGALEDKLRMMGGNLEEVQLENLHLKELLKNSEDELRTVTSVSDQLNHEIANGKDLLNQKEIELSEAEHKLTATENEKSELQKIVEVLKKEHDEVKMVRDDQERQILKVLEEKRSLTKKLLDLEEKNRTLEGENFSVVGEMLSLSNLSLIFKNIINEKSVELKELNEDLDKLHGVNGALEDKLRMMGGNLAEVQLENLHLKEFLKNSEDELRTVTSVSDQLNHEIANGKDLLNQKEIELSEAEHKLTATENEKSELQKIVEVLKKEHDEVKMVRDDQERQILKLSKDNNHLSKENGCLQEANQELEVELHHLHEEHEKTRSREESLFYEVQKGNNEIDLWEGEATTFYGDLQISAFFQALFEEKVHQLSEACKSLDGETTSKSMDIELLKERISTLEGENGGLKTQLAAYVPAINSLKDCILSLENHTCLHRKLQKSNNEGVQDAELANHHDVESCQELSADQKLPDDASELRDLQTRVKAVEKAVIEMERFMTQENINANTKLEAAMKQIDELKFKGGSNQENVRPTSEISEVENGLLTKDIMLDQISECSSYGISRREHANADSQMLELWDTGDLDGSIDLTVGKGKKIVTAPTEKGSQVEVVKKQRSKYPNSEILIEKELGVDKLEISRTFSESRREVNKSKVLERLNSDIQKLTNLQITVQDLKRKVDFSEKGKNNKAFDDCDTLKGQLEEAEETILKLFDLNGKLMKTIEDRSFPADGKPPMDSEESGSVNNRRRKISEQARKVSEKIGRLQLEVQKIQFVLLKLDDENEKESKGKTIITDSNRRVLLRDYLYGGIRTGYRRKKGAFCACVRPPTKGD